MNNRKATLFPPFSRLLNLTFRSVSEEKARDAADELGELASRLEESSKVYEDIEIFSPSPCPVEKRARYYRYHILLRSVSASLLLSFAHKLLDDYKVPSGVYLEIDMDPVSIM